MKDIRSKNDIRMTWVVRGVPAYTDMSVVLYSPSGRECPMVNTSASYNSETHNYVFNGTFAGRDQRDRGIYRLELHRNYGELDQNVLDKIHAFRLWGPVEWGIERGTDPDNLTTVVVQLESTFTAATNAGLDPADYYTRGEVDALLDEKEDILNYYSEDTGNGAAAIEVGNAKVKVSDDDGGTVDIKATHTSVEDGGGNVVLVGASGQSGVSVNTANGKKFTYNGNEVATKNEIPAQDIVVWDVTSAPHPDLSAYTWAELESIINSKKCLVLVRPGMTYMYVSSILTDGTTLTGVIAQTLAATPYSILMTKNGTAITYTEPTAPVVLTLDNYTEYVFTKSQVTTLLAGKQDVINDLASIRSGAAAGATALQDAPSDGHQYARENGQWVEVQASGGGGSLTIVDVERGTSAITAEVDKYYKVAGAVNNLAITLPTIASSEIVTKKIMLALTTASNPNITFTTADTSAHINYYDGYAIAGGYSYILTVEWNGSAWCLTEVKQSGGTGPTGEGEQVSVALMQKVGDSVTNITTGGTIIVTIDGTSTVYQTGSTGSVTFTVPYGYSYSVTAAHRNGQYISGNGYTQSYTASQSSRVITFVFRTYESGLFITTADGTDYTLQEWEDAVAVGSRENSEALYIHAMSAALINNSSTFLVKIDHLRERSYGSNAQWCATNVQFNTIAFNGTGDYNGLTQTRKVITEASQRGLSVPAFTRCNALSESVGGVTAEGFLGAYQQWNFLWNNKAEIDDILVSTRPNGTYTFSSLTTNKWTSSQTNANNAYCWASAAANLGKNASYVVVPFFAF